MPSATPSARYDLPWKAALTHAFRAFITFFFPELCSKIDWRVRPRFCDKELAGIGFGDAPGVMVADKLVEVALRDGGAHWVLIHIEVQAQRDAALARRVLAYNYRIFESYGHPVASLVVLADEDPGWRPSAFHSRAFGTVMGISFAAVKLLDYAERTEELMASHNPFAWLTLAHLRTQQAQHDPAALYAAKWQSTRLLFEHGWSKRRIMALFKAVNWMMVLPAPLQQRYWRDIVKLDKEQNMNIMEWVTPLEQMFIDKGQKKGLKKGLQQGLEQGRREGARVILERQLAQRFGPLPKTIRSKLAKASMAQLEAWSDGLQQAESLKQLFA